MSADSFSSATDEQRRVARIMMELAGCPKCPSMRVRHGRNCNEFYCSVQASCNQMKLVKEAARQIAQEEEAKNEPGQPAQSL